MLQRFLLLWLTASSLAAYYWPSFVGNGYDPFVATKPILGWLIALTMFAIGSLLRREEIADVLAHWPTVISGTAIQYTAMPLLAFSCAKLFQLQGDALIGVIMVGCVPGAMASNVLTLAARGNVSYSVSLTTTATLLSPLAVPLALKLTLGSVEPLDPLAVSRNLLLTVVGPVVTGYLLARRSPAFSRTMSTYGSTIANLTILWIIAVVVGLNRERLANVAGTVLLALMIVNLLGYAAGYFGGRLLRLAEPMRRALTLEVGMQNAGVGTALVLALFPDRPAAAIPTAAYTFGCMLTGSVLAQIWALRPADANQEP